MTTVQRKKTNNAFFLLHKDRLKRNFLLHSPTHKPIVSNLRPIKYADYRPTIQQSCPPGGGRGVQEKKVKFRFLILTNPYSACSHGKFGPVVKRPKLYLPTSRTICSLPNCTCQIWVQFHKINRNSIYTGSMYVTMVNKVLNMN